MCLMLLTGSYILGDLQSLGYAMISLSVLYFITRD